MCSTSRYFVFYNRIPKIIEKLVTKQHIGRSRNIVACILTPLITCLPLTFYGLPVVAPSMSTTSTCCGRSKSIAHRDSNMCTLSSSLPKVTVFAPCYNMVEYMILDWRVIYIRRTTLGTSPKLSPSLFTIPQTASPYQCVVSSSAFCLG